MRFPFEPASANAAKYEFVELLKNTPRNTSDYDDLQLIFRHRIAALIRELFGNCRISPALGSNETTFKIPFAYQSNKTHFAFSGVWYVDGYRVSLDAVNSIQFVQEGTNYNVYLGLTFVEEEFDDYKDCAIYDAGTKKYIQTSTRVKILPRIGLTTGSSVFTGNDGEYVYKIGTALWNVDDSNWDFEDAVEFPYIRNKYTEAMDIVANAVHADPIDNKTVEIKRLVTEKDSGKANIYIEEIDENKIRIGMETESGNLFSAYEMVKENGEWMPILWMQPGNLSGYPVSYFTPEGFKIYDNRGSVGEYTNKSINIGNGVNSFSADRDELSFSTGGIKGFSVKRFSNNSTIIKPAVSRDATNTTATAPDGLFIVAPSLIRSNNQSTGKSAIFTFSLAKGQYPTDQIMKLNHKIVFNTGSYTESVVLATVEVSTDNITWAPTQNQNWILKPGNSVITSPFEFSLQTGSINLDNETTQVATLYVKITYSIRTMEDVSAAVEAKVAFLNGAPAESEVYDNVHPVGELHVAMINGCLLWADADGRLRIKKTSATTIGADAHAMTTNPAGTSLTSPGGMYVASGNGIDTISLPVASSGDDIIDGPMYDPDTNALVIPVVNPSATNDHAKLGGLITNSQYQALHNALSAINAGKNPLAQNVIYVSPEWKTSAGEVLTLDFPYATNLNVALQWAQEKTWTTPPVILVYPGAYTGNYSLVSSVSYPGNAVSIVAVDPKFTSIIGSITDGQKKLTAYIDVPVVPSGGAGVSITKDSNITFGPNATIVSNSTQTTELISISGNAQVKFLADVIHGGTTLSDCVVKIGVYNKYTPNVSFYGTVYGFNTKKLFNIYSGYLNTYGTLSNNSKDLTSGNAVIHVSGDSANCVHDSKIFGQIITDGIPAVYVDGNNWTYKPKIELFGAVYCNQAGTGAVAVPYAVYAKGGSVFVHNKVINASTGRAVTVDTAGKVYIRHATVQGTDSDSAVYLANTSGLIVLDHATVLSAGSYGIKSVSAVQTNLINSPIQMTHTCFNKELSNITDDAFNNGYNSYLPYIS